MKKSILLILMVFAAFSASLKAADTATIPSEPAVTAKFAGAKNQVTRVASSFANPANPIFTPATNSEALTCENNRKPYPPKRPPESRASATVLTLPRKLPEIVQLC